MNRIGRTILAISIMAVDNQAAEITHQAELNDLHAEIATLKKVTDLVTKVVTELAKIETETTNTALQTTKKGLQSILDNMYDLVSPLVLSQTVYKSDSGQNYVIPTASITTRNQYDLSEFIQKNKQAIEKKNSTEDYVESDQKETDG